MVGIGIASCRSSYCACDPDGVCCIPNEWEWVWDAPGCALHNTTTSMVHDTVANWDACGCPYTFTDGPVYPPSDGKVSWGFSGDVWSAAECEDDAVNAGVMVYCAMINGEESIVAQAYCFDAGQNVVGYKIGITTDFTCDPFSFSIVTEDELCCGCNGDGGTGVNVECCEQSLPTTLYGTMTGTLSGSITLVWDGSGWEGSTTACGDTFAFRLDCLPIINGPGCDSMQVGPPTSVSPACTVSPAVPTETCYCDPLQLTYTNIATQNGTGTCCAGTVTIVITE